ncbi:MAG: hypothetical protein OXD38_06050 [Aestuariivita sp.]|nr:hypothetical protein [Aestuariivita sp.]
MRGFPARVGIERLEAHGPISADGFPRTRGDRATNSRLFGTKGALKATANAVTIETLSDLEVASPSLRSGRGLTLRVS